MTRLAEFAMFVCLQALFDKEKPACPPSAPEKIERFVDSVVNGGAALNRKVANSLSIV